MNSRQEKLAMRFIELFAEKALAKTAADRLQLRYRLRCRLRVSAEYCLLLLFVLLCGCSTAHDRQRSALDGAAFGIVAGSALGCSLAGNVREGSASDYAVATFLRPRKWMEDDARPDPSREWLR
jgi:hypothetical protein